MSVPLKYHKWRTDVFIMCTAMGAAAPIVGGAPLAVVDS